MTGDPVVHVPPDLEIEDRLAGPVTFRMAGWLAIAAAGTALVLLAGGQWFVIALGMVLVPLGLLGALWLPAERPLSSWASPMWAYRRRRRQERVTDEPEQPPSTGALRDDARITSRRAEQPKPSQQPKPEPELAELANPTPDPVAAESAALFGDRFQRARGWPARRRFVAVLVVVAVLAGAGAVGWLSWPPGWPGRGARTAVPTTTPPAEPQQRTAEAESPRVEPGPSLAPVPPREPVLLVPADPFWWLDARVEAPCVC